MNSNSLPYSFSVVDGMAVSTNSFHFAVVVTVLCKEDPNLLPFPAKHFAHSLFVLLFLPFLIPL